MSVNSMLQSTSINRILDSNQQDAENKLILSQQHAALYLSALQTNKSIDSLSSSSGTTNQESPTGSSSASSPYDLSLPVTSSPSSTYTHSVEVIRPTQPSGAPMVINGQFGKVLSPYDTKIPATSSDIFTSGSVANVSLSSSSVPPAFVSGTAAYTSWDGFHQPNAWLEMQTIQHHHNQMAAATYGQDYHPFPPSSFNPLAANTSLLSSVGSPYDSLQSVFSNAVYPERTGTRRPVLTTSAKSSRRYSTRANCSCPNCLEAERLGPGAVSHKPKVHSCHIPGCGKIYNKTSHLKAHLRWHSSEKRIACPLCSKRFQRSDHLSKHVKEHGSLKTSPKQSAPQSNINSEYVQ